MKMMTAVFSYDRGIYLENFIKSFHLFSPQSQLVVFDDGSGDEHTKHVLDRIADRNEVIVTGGAGAEHGGLFNNMNTALDMAATRGFELLHLVQDDFQFVWRDEQLLHNVTQLLAHSDASEATVHFWKRLGFDRSMVLPSRDGYRSRTGIADVGIFPVQRLVETGFRFEQSEAQSAKKAVEAGLQSYSVADPVLARIPWPMHARHKKMHGTARRGVAPLLLKPLDSEAILRLRARDLSVRPYGEDFYEPWGWRCWKPYPTGPSYASWGKSLLAAARDHRSVRGLIPRRAGQPL